VIEAKGAKLLAAVGITNNSCKPVAFTPELANGSRLIFTKESAVRWESQAVGSDQWVAYTGILGEPRPSGKITLLLQKNEHATAYVELGEAETQSPKSKLRLFLTDTQGVSRSSNVFELSKVRRLDGGVQ
jgi:hypothetical protein